MQIIGKYREKQSRSEWVGRLFCEYRTKEENEDFFVFRNAEREITDGYAWRGNDSWICVGKTDSWKHDDWQL